MKINNNTSNQDSLIWHHIAANGGILPMTMRELRDAVGKKKLGRDVLKDIEHFLECHGLRVAKHQLSLNQADVVYVYLQGSNVGRIIDAVVNPTNNHAREIRAMAKRNNDQSTSRYMAVI